MDSHRMPPAAPPPEADPREGADARALRAIAVRRARLSLHMRRHERPLSK